MIAQYAKRLNSKRIALVAEAAHVVPPIGAQGLNMSLKDIKTLMDLAEKTHDVGAFDILERYHKMRINDIRLRVNGINLLNQASLSSNQMIRDIRSYGINMFHSSIPIRKGLMKLGLGLSAWALNISEHLEFIMLKAFKNFWYVIEKNNI